jgi:dimethylaniline monooxygenase (N-oxide forming)
VFSDTIYYTHGKMRHNTVEENLLIIPQMRVAVIGAGISGIGAAKVLKQKGYDVTIFEKSGWIGGVWSGGYQELHLQSHAPQYHFTDFPWPFEPQRHPTCEEVMKYLNLAVVHYGLNIKLHHEVISMEERVDGWLVCFRNQIGSNLRFFDYVIISSGLFTEGKFRPHYPGEDTFEGKIVTEREIDDPKQFQDKTVVVMGYGEFNAEIY